MKNRLKIKIKKTDSKEAAIYSILNLIKIF